MFARTVSLAAALMALVLLAGCGGSGSNGPTTFVGNYPTFVGAISWTDDGDGHLTGSLQTATPNTSGTRELVKNVNISFTGMLNAGQVSIVGNAGLGSTATWTGSLSGDVLTLNMPQDNGSIAPVTFTRNEIGDYNSAVTKFAAQVTQERAKVASDAADAAAQAEAEAVRATAARALAEADKQVADGIIALRGLLTQGVSFGEFATDMTMLRSDLATANAGAAKAKAEGRANPDACSDAGVAQSDAGAVESDAGAIESDAGAAGSTISTVTDSAESLRNAYAEAKTAYQQQDRTFPVSAGARVKDVLNDAKEAVTSWKTRSASYVATGHELAAQATTTADAASQAVC